MRLAPVAATALVLAFAAAQPAAARNTAGAKLKEREHRQVAAIQSARYTLRFFERHPWLLYRASERTRRIAWRMVRFSRARVGWATRELAETRAALDRLFPPRGPWWVPDAFKAAALCVHDGWWHEPRPPFRRTQNVPDGLAGGSGEADWANRSDYRGGLQFAWSTWRRAGGVGDPADASPDEQIFRAWVIVVRQDGGSWREWPQTARACGLPQ